MASLQAQSDSANIKIMKITVLQGTDTYAASILLEATIPSMFLSLMGYKNLKIKTKSVAKIQ